VIGNQLTEQMRKSEGSRRKKEKKICEAAEFGFIRVIRYHSDNSSIDIVKKAMKK
jgi:hypothetical protein